MSPTASPEKTKNFEFGTGASQQANDLMAYKKRFDELKAELTSKEKEIEQLKAN